MSLLEVLVLAFGVSLDAFAVSISGSLIDRRRPWRNAMLAAFFFGGFQGVMPLLGYGVGSLLQQHLACVDHWLAFGLLGVVGGKMVYDGATMNCDEEQLSQSPFCFKSMLVLAVATSLDAMAVGATFSLIGQPILFPAAAMAVVTGGLAALGVGLGTVLGQCFCKRKMTIAGGLAIIGIGMKILLEHLCS